MNVKQTNKPQLCMGETRYKLAVPGCHMAEDIDGEGTMECDHPTTWTWRGVLSTDGALTIADMYVGTWDEDVEEHGMAHALLVLANEVRALREDDTLPF